MRSGGDERRHRGLWLIVVVLVIGIAGYWLLLRTPPLTADQMIRSAHQACLDLGHTEAECAGTN